MITARAYGRIGIAGNPSDGYCGKTVSAAVENFFAECTVEKSGKVEIKTPVKCEISYRSFQDMSETLARTGYTPGFEIFQASLKQFYMHFASEITDPVRIEVTTTVPLQSGLAGSSAIVTAILKGLLYHFNCRTEKKRFPEMILDTEQKELGITAGLQDRVAQVYEGLTYMDFAPGQSPKTTLGRYEYLAEELLPPIYLFYRKNAPSSSGRIHRSIRKRYCAGDIRIVSYMDEIAECAFQFRKALLNGDIPRMKAIMDHNFNLRKTMFPIDEDDLAVISLLRTNGFCAKLAGSHNGIVGIVEHETALNKIRSRFKKMNVTIEKVVLKKRNRESLIFR